MLEHRSKINAKLWDFGNRLDDCAREIDNRKISINDLYNPLKAVTCDDMPKGSGTTSDTTLATVELIERYQMELIGYVKLKEKILKEFEQYIIPLKHQQKEILRLRYLNGLSAFKISQKKNYSEDHVKRLLGQAQDKLYI